MKKSVLKAIFVVGWKIPLAYLTWLNRYNKHKDKYPLSERYKKIRDIVSKIAYGLGMDIVVSGLENVPNETCAFFSNHLAAPDPLPIITMLDKPMAFLAKKELMSAPFASTAIECMGGLYLDRDDLKQSLRTMMKIEEELRNGEKNWLIFPEGTRNKDDKANLLEFHHGTFRPAVKAGVPLVPVAVFGAQRVFSDKSKYKKYPVHLVFDKPIYPSEYQDLSTQEVASLVQSRVQYLLTYKCRKDDRAYMKKMLGPKFKENL